jgi:hypothetical protein
MVFAGQRHVPSALKEIIVKQEIAMAAALCFLTLSAWAAPKDESWSGWISDSKCGAKGASASHAACAKKWIGAGEKAVLVTDKDQKIVALDNPDAVSGQVGQHVEVSAA